MGMPNIFSLFESRPAPAAPAKAASGIVPGTGEAAIVAAGTVAAIPAAGTGDKSPLSNFRKLFDNTGIEVPAKPAPMFANDPKKLLEAAQTIDFAKVIPPEVRAKIVGGGADAAEAFSEAINVVSQQAYAQSAHATTRLVEAALTKQREQLLAELPNLVRKHAISETLRADNPLFTNPASAPILKILEERLQLQNPTASAADLSTMAKQYLTEFASVVTASNVAATDNAATKTGLNKTGVGEENWAAFFGQPET